MPASAKKQDVEQPLQAVVETESKQPVKPAEKVTQLKTQPAQKEQTAASKKAPESRGPKKRLTRAEQVKRQANPKSILTGKQKTINLSFEYASDILHEYLELNQSTMLSAYERLAGLMRLCANDASTYKHVNEWIATNLHICQRQLESLAEQRTVLIDEHGDELEPLDVHVPDDYRVVFETSHPVSRKMLALLRLVDNELNATEDLFMQGVVDDAAYVQLRNQVSSIVRSSVDRIFKATSPGVRNGGRFQPSQLANWIRKGNKMMFVDVPREFTHLVEEK